MKLLIPVLLLCLTACASQEPSELIDEPSSEATIYGQLSGSIDSTSTR